MKAQANDTNTTEPSYAELLGQDLNTFLEEASSEALVEALEQIAGAVFQINPLLAANIRAWKNGPDMRGALTEIFFKIQSDHSWIYEQQAHEITAKWLPRLDAAKWGDRMPPDGFIISAPHVRATQSGFSNGHSHPVHRGRVNCEACFAVDGSRAYGYLSPVARELEALLGAAKTEVDHGVSVIDAVDRAFAKASPSVPTIEQLARAELRRRLGDGS